MEKSNRAWVKYIVRLSVSILALIFVFRKVEISLILHSIADANIWILIPALLLFNVSKILSAFRLNTFFRAVGCFISTRYNLRLYYVGMFYNLLLPGGIGGDAYKVYLLNKQQKAPVKDLVTVTIIDRITGMAALIMLASVLLLFSTLSGVANYVNYIGSGVAIMVLPVFYLLIVLFFKKFKSVFWTTNLQAFGVQMAQLLTALFIIMALGIQDNRVDYLFVFLISSLVSVIPFTIGGLGARELVFLYAGKWLHLSSGDAIATGTLFFVITLLSSITGVFLKTKDE